MTTPDGELYKRPVTDHDRIQIKRAMRDTMDSWQDIQSCAAVVPGTEAAFDVMADEFQKRVKEHDATTERFRDSGAMIGGCEIFGRYFYAGALTGALNGLSLDALRQMMFNRTSYKTIEYLTREMNSAAKEIEFENGLRRVTYSHIDEDPNRFGISADGGLILTDYRLQRMRSRLRLADEDKISYDEVLEKPEDTPTKCELNHNGAFAMCYKAMCTIALRDPSLAPATLQRTDINRPLVVE
jgi:hypothetical protein